mgnify:FL=1|jgi:hypothetical protein
MSEPLINCPKCQTTIKLTESLAAPLLAATKAEFEQKLAKRDEEFARRDSALRHRETALAKDREEIDSQVAEKLRTERTKIAEDEAQKAKLLLGDDLNQKTKEVAELSQALAEKNKKLAEAQTAQAEFSKKQRELDDKARELDLTVEKRVSEQVGAARVQAKKEAEDDLKLKVAERDSTIQALQRKLEEAQKRAEQGSQQLQGEVQEVELRSLLAASFPTDNVDPVPKGEFGGDVVHRVLSPLGQVCGTILWESKRTKAWVDGWLPKLRDDQRMAKADIAVVVSQTMPKGVETFTKVDGVWITEPRFAIPLAIAFRSMLIEVAMARGATEGQQTKMEMVYEYLTGPRFRHRVEAIVEAFSTMRKDLDSERKAITKQWAKREEQLTRVMTATVGMYGDLQGIAGKSLQEIEGISLLPLQGESATTDLSSIN